MKEYHHSMFRVFKKRKENRHILQLFHVDLFAFLIRQLHFYFDSMPFVPFLRDKFCLPGCHGQTCFYHSEPLNQQPVNIQNFPAVLLRAHSCVSLQYAKLAVIILFELAACGRKTVKLEWFSSVFHVLTYEGWDVKVELELKSFTLQGLQSRFRQKPNDQSWLRTNQLTNPFTQTVAEMEGITQGIREDNSPRRVTIQPPAASSSIVQRGQAQKNGASTDPSKKEESKTRKEICLPCWVRFRCFS